MRIAEHFMQKSERLNNELFLVGNIGPDCGVPNDDWSVFTPDKNITHWWSKDGKYIDTDDFKSRYLNADDVRYPFYLGYYLHLITDIQWSKLYKKKRLEPIYSEGLARDKGFIWTIKKDWYGQDNLFLQSHPESVFYRIFSKIDAFENNYFDFYPDNAFIRQIKYITNFYLSASEDPKRDFPFLSKSEMDNFVHETINIIQQLNFCILRQSQDKEYDDELDRYDWGETDEPKGRELL